MCAAHARIQLQRRFERAASAIVLTCVTVSATDQHMGLRQRPGLCQFREQPLRDVDRLALQI